MGSKVQEATGWPSLAAWGSKNVPAMSDDLPRPRRWYDRDRPVLAVLCAWLLLIFGMVWNPWWMPSGDAEVFLVTARNLMQGQGLTFNGYPVAIVPPGWPLLLAGLLHLTDSYLWLKGVQILLMIAFLLLSYATLRRFTTVRIAAIACGLAGILWPLYPLTMWLHSDAFFCAIAAGIGLLAVQWGDGRLARGWLVAIILGCALAVFVRWAALVQVFVLMALACGSGRVTQGRMEAWPRLTPRQALGMAAIFVATLGTFAGLKSALSAQQAAPAPAAISHEPSLLPLARVPLPEEVLAPELFVGGEDPDRTALETVTHRILAIPQWLSWTLFFPLRVLDGFSPVGVPVGLWIDRGVGLLAMAMIGLAAWRAVRGSAPHYLWVGVLVYVVALSLNWPHVNNRYIVPIAPFVVAGVLVGLAELRAWRTFRILRWSFIAAVLGINGALWAVDVMICRSRSAETFYARWEAGIYQSLIEVGVYLDGQEGIEDGQIVASERYQNLNERWEYPLSPRSMVLMTGKQVRSVPTPLTGAGVRKAQSWARETGAWFYVQQNPTFPGRIWHFRVSPELEEKLTGWPPAPERPQFELFTLRPDPIPANPDLWSLQYEPVPVVKGQELERVTRHVPKVRD